jgi:hypothetical protein
MFAAVLAIGLALGFSCGKGSKSVPFKPGTFYGSFEVAGRTIEVYCTLADNGSAAGVVQIAGTITARKRLALGEPLTFFNATDFENSSWSENDGVVALRSKAVTGMAQDYALDLMLKASSGGKALTVTGGAVLYATDNVAAVTGTLHFATSAPSWTPIDSPFTIASTGVGGGNEEAAVACFFDNLNNARTNYIPALDGLLPVYKISGNASALAEEIAANPNAMTEEEWKAYIGDQITNWTLAACPWADVTNATVLVAQGYPDAGQFFSALMADAGTRHVILGADYDRAVVAFANGGAYWIVAALNAGSVSSSGVVSVSGTISGAEAGPFASGRAYDSGNTSGADVTINFFRATNTDWDFATGGEFGEAGFYTGINDKIVYIVIPNPTGPGDYSVPSQAQVVCGTFEDILASIYSGTLTYAAVGAGGTVTLAASDLTLGGYVEGTYNVNFVDYTMTPVGSLSGGFMLKYFIYHE